MDPVTFALVLAGAIIVIGFLGNYLLERIGLPDILFLIVLGMLVGPATGLIDASSVMGFAPYIAALALVFILFDGGMTMNIYRVFSESPRAAVLATAGFASSATVTSLFMYFTVLSSDPPLYSILFGTILGGSSSIIVMSLASRIKLGERSSTILSLESAINDILCIVLSLVIIEIVVFRGSVDLTTIAKSVASRFSIGAMLGIIVGVCWLSILKRIVKTTYSYMLTLGIALLSYSASEFLGGSGALSSLLFGIMLGNEREIYGILRMRKPANHVVDAGLKRFESEMAFLLRTFFFVYIGLIATAINAQVVAVGIILALTLFLVRFGAVHLATIRSDLIQDRPIMSVLLTRGLASAVLATLPLQYADPAKYPDIAGTFQRLSPIYINTAVIVIMTTAIIATVGIPLLRWKTRKQQSQHLLEANEDSEEKSSPRNRKTRSIDRPLTKGN